MVEYVEIVEGSIEPPTIQFPTHIIDGEGATRQVHGIGQDEIKILGEYACAAKARAHCKNLFNQHALQNYDYTTPRLRNARRISRQLSNHPA